MAYFYLMMVNLKTSGDYERQFWRIRKEYIEKLLVILVKQSTFSVESVPQRSQILPLLVTGEGA